MRRLSFKQEKFCEEYVKEGSASKAYRKVYKCDNMKCETINNNAYNLLKRSEVTARVEQLSSEMRAKSKIEKEEILKLCADILRGANVTDYVEDKGGVKSARTIPKTWAITRICKMLGFDSPTEIALKNGDAEMSREDMVKELERLEALRKEE